MRGYQQLPDFDNAPRRAVGGRNPTTDFHRTGGAGAKRSIEMENLASPTEPLLSMSPENHEVIVTRPPVLGRDSPRRSPSWGRIVDLDLFFACVYKYHKQRGFWCIVLEDVFELLRFTFVALFVGFLLTCVDYPVLFKEKSIIKKIDPNLNSSTMYIGWNKVTLSDAISFDPSKLSVLIILCGLIALIFWFYWLIVLCWKISRTVNMSRFYKQLLNLEDKDLENLTWLDVLQRLREAQTMFQFCVHKSTLNELDVYHQILRRKNYLVALFNKHLLPVRFNLPLLGEVCFFTNGFKFNFEFLFFLGWYSPWKDYWRLKEDYKKPECTRLLSQKLESVVFWLFVLNLLLSPVIFVWQIFYSLFSYGELFKREPGLLGVRRWSIYGKYFFRHFNELDHELEYRLSLAYRPACQYLDMFRSDMAEILARNLVFFLGAPVIVLLALGIYDEDVLQVQHVLTIITVCGLIVALCKSFVVNSENLVQCPELMLKLLAAHLHYVPDEWTGKAHTTLVRKEFSSLFQYTASFVMEELFSPVLTPFVLLFWLKPRCYEFLEFFRKFTVEVPSLGDVCSFALLDVRRHGDAKWHPQTTATTGPSETNEEQQPPPDEADNEEQVANLGKTEISLVRFKLANPDWAPPLSSERFLASVRRRCERDARELALLNSTSSADLEYKFALENNTLLQSFKSISSPYFAGDFKHPTINEGIVSPALRQSLITHGTGIEMLGSNAPLCFGSTNVDRLFSSLALEYPNDRLLFERYQKEPGASAEMMLTTVYLRELRQRNVRPRFVDYGSMHSIGVEASRGGLSNDPPPPPPVAVRIQNENELLDLWRIPGPSNAANTTNLLNLGTLDDGHEEVATATSGLGLAPSSSSLFSKTLSSGEDVGMRSTLAESSSNYDDNDDSDGDGPPADFNV